jgi:hypothetical protein
MEGAFVGSLVADEESQRFSIHAIFGEAIILEAQGALGEPVRLGHLVDEHLFGGVGGLMIGEKGVKERFEIGAVLAGDDHFAGCQAVFERVTRRSQFPRRSNGAG